MKTIKIVFTLVVFVMMGLTVTAQTKKDTTVIFKVGIRCPSCKAKLDKNIPFEKGVKDYNLNLKDSTVRITFQMVKNTVPALKAAIERYDVKVVGVCDQNGKLIKCHKDHKSCKEGKKEGHGCACDKKGQVCDKSDKGCGSECSGKCDQKCGDQKCEEWFGGQKDSKCEGKCGDECCSKTGKTEECCKNKKK